MRHVAALLMLLGVLASPRVTMAQAFSQRGFIEGQALLYPQVPEAGNDWHSLVHGLFRQEAAWRPLPWFTVAGALDARADGRDRVAASWAIEWDDRSSLRPRLSVRRASVAFRGRGFNVEFGKQIVRWGKADIVNPTDRFAPRDFLDVVDSEVLPIWAARLLYERGSNSVDVVLQPRMTPSRMPLLGQRWAMLPQPRVPFPIEERPAQYPARSAVGVRWNHNAPGVEFSLSFYDGFQHVPRLDQVACCSRPVIVIARSYPGIRMAGADVAWPTRWVTLRVEAAHSGSRDGKSDDYTMFVVQLERQAGEWLFVGGYAGEAVSARREPRSGAPERGLSKTFLGRASYTIDAVRNLAVEWAVQQSGRGAYVESEYSQLFGQHLRLAARLTLIGGRADDFLGQYRRNSSAGLTVRYSY